MSDPESPPPDLKFWSDPEPGRLVGRGHNAGDFLEAYNWTVLETRAGWLRVRAPLPDHLLNPRGELFGGFTPAYVDFMALHSFWAGRDFTPGDPWLVTLNLRIDYFDPIRGPEFEMVGRLVHTRGGLSWMECQFEDPSGKVLALGHATLKTL